MMSREQNDQLSRIGPGTLMGKLLRRYWAPFLLASEIPEPDCPPVRVKLMGEKLVAFRDTKGQHRPDRRVLRPSRRLALVRRKRRVRHPLPLSRLEIRRHRPMRRPAVGAGGIRLPQEHQAEILSLHREGRHRLGLYGAARAAAAAAGAGMDRRRARRSVSCRSACRNAITCRRWKAASIPATCRGCTARSSTRIRCSRARRATSTTNRTACRCSRSRNSPAAC